MADVLMRIKRAVLAGRYLFSEKATVEMEADGLTDLDIVESIANAPAIDKRIRSTSPGRRVRREYLYIIQSPNLDGTPIYTKGKLTDEAGRERYYFLISSKRAERGVSAMIDITACPNCGSGRIQKVSRDVTRRVRGEAYTVPNLTFYECPACGERVYDREAVRRIEACSPAFAKADI